MRRLLLASTAVVTLAVPAGFLVAATSPSTAWASGSSVTCKSLKGTITGSFTVSKCSPKSKTNKSASGSSSSLAGGTGTLTWTKSGQTTDVSLTINQVTPSTCKKGADEYSVTGSVVAGGNSTYTNTGDAVSGDACISGNNITLLPKSVMDL
jgi:hypothetical protein